MTLDDMPRSGRNHDQGRVFKNDYDFIRSLSADTCLYCLSKQQVSALLATADYLGWKTRWFSRVDTEISQDWLDGFKADIVRELMADNCDIITLLNDIEHKINVIGEDIDGILADMLIIKPQLNTIQTSSAAAAASSAAGVLEMTATLEPAIVGLAATLAGISLQVSGVQGTSNAIKADVENPDYGLAEIDEDVDAIEITVGKLKSGITNVYNFTTNLNFGGYSSFDSAPTDNTSTEVYARSNALCEAVLQWVLLEVYAVMDTLGAVPADLAALQLQIDVSFRSLNAMLTTGSSYPYDALTIFAAVSDSAAVDDVVCAIVSQLAPLAVTQENFQTAFNSYVPPVYPDNRAILVAALTEAFNFLDAWTTFASMLADEYTAQLALAPTGYLCTACPPNTGLGVYNFVPGTKYGWLIINGKMTVGLGIESTNYWSVASGANHALAYIELKMSGAVTVNHVKVTVGDDNNPEGRGTAGANRFFFVAYTILVAGVPTRFVSGAQSASSGATVTMDFFIGSPPKLPLLLEIYSTLDVWHHWITQVELT